MRKELGTVTYYNENPSDLYRFAGELGMPIMAFPEDHDRDFNPPTWLTEMCGEMWGLEVASVSASNMNHESANSIRYDRDSGKIHFENLSDESWAETDKGGEFNSTNIRVHCPNEMRKYLLQG